MDGDTCYLSPFFLPIWGDERDVPASGWLPMEEIRPTARLIIPPDPGDQAVRFAKNRFHRAVNPRYSLPRYACKVEAVYLAGETREGRYLWSKRQEDAILLLPDRVLALVAAAQKAGKDVVLL